MGSWHCLQMLLKPPSSCSGFTVFQRQHLITITGFEWRRSKHSSNQWFSTGCKSLCTIIMDSLLIPLPAAREVQLMPSCATYRTQTNIASGSVWEWESHCHHRVWQWLSSILVHTYIWFRSNQTKASLSRLTDRLSLVKCIPPSPPLVVSCRLCRNAAHSVIMIMSCAVEFYHVSPSPHFSQPRS